MSDPKPVELKPCPFCGSVDIEVERVGTARVSCIVHCLDCGCRLESGETGFGSSWNTRAQTNSAQTGSKLVDGKAVLSDGTSENPHTRECNVMNDNEVWLKFKELVERNNKLHDENAELEAENKELKSDLESEMAWAHRYHRELREAEAQLTAAKAEAGAMREALSDSANYLRGLFDESQVFQLHVSTLLADKCDEALSQGAGKALLEKLERLEKVLSEARASLHEESHWDAVNRVEAAIHKYDKAALDRANGEDK